MSLFLHLSREEKQIVLSLLAWGPWLENIRAGSMRCINLKKKGSATQVELVMELLYPNCRFGERHLESR